MLCVAVHALPGVTNTTAMTCAIAVLHDRARVIVIAPTVAIAIAVTDHVHIDMLRTVLATLTATIARLTDCTDTTVTSAVVTTIAGNPPPPGPKGCRVLGGSQGARGFPRGTRGAAQAT